jgi:hypothetical protein
VTWRPRKPQLLLKCLNSRHFDMTKMADSYREMADKSVNQTKEAYAKVKAASRRRHQGDRSDP